MPIHRWALADILRADFLLREALVGSVLLGLVCRSSESISCCGA
jgi:hypothetical protein